MDFKSLVVPWGIGINKFALYMKYPHSETRRRHKTQPNQRKDSWFKVPTKWNILIPSGGDLWERWEQPKVPTWI